MNPGEMIAELTRSGIQLWEERGDLRYRAPRGAMTDALRDRIRQHKAELIDYLSEPAWTIASAPELRYEPFPLTDIQAAYLLGRDDHFALGGVACHAYGELVFHELDPMRLEEAWNHVISRHDMMRAVVSRDGYQRVLADCPRYHIEVDDRRGEGVEAFRSSCEARRARLDHEAHDPESWPLFTVHVTQGPSESVVHFSFDFLIADYLSIHLVLRELRQLYDGKHPLPAPPSITFRDYISAERRMREAQPYRRARQYWSDRLDSLPPSPSLPVLGSPSAPRFVRQALSLAPDQWDALCRRCKEHGVTGSSAILGAYSEVLARWSAQVPLTVNVTLMHRLPVHRDVDRLVGDFSSVNLLAVDPAAGGTFATRVRAIQYQLWQDLEHRQYSGVEVMRELARRRGRSHALFPIVYTSAIGLDRGEGHDTGDWSDIRNGISQTPQVTLDCQVMPARGGLAISWDIRQDVFPAGLVEAMFASFAELLSRLANDAETWLDAEPVSCSPPLPEAATATTPLRFGALHEGFADRASLAPERIALVVGAESFTYAQLMSKACAVASALCARDVSPGEPVAVVAEASLDQIAAILGSSMAGAAYLPIDVEQPVARRNRIIADSGVRLALLGHDDSCWDAGVERILLEHLPPVGGVTPMPAVSSDSAAYVMYTSGSTGKPKGVVVSHRSALHTIEDINRRFSVGPADRVLGIASVGFDLSVYDIFGVLAAGGTLVLPEHERRRDPSRWAELVRRADVTIWNSVPAQLGMLTDYLDDHRDIALPTLRLALVSGDWIPVRLPDAARARLPGLRIVSLGGATEAAIWSIFYPINEVDPSWPSIPYGRPLSEQHVYVLDRTLAPCPVWVTGELYISGAGLATGYHRDPVQTAERFITNPRTGERMYRTGDFGRYLPDGNIQFLGREDRQVKIRGHRIELAEIESVLASHPGVAEAAVEVIGAAAHDLRIAAAVRPAVLGVVCSDVPERISRLAGSICAATESLDRERMIAFADQLDRTALICMAHALRREGLFDAANSRHTFEDIVARLRVAPAHHRLVRRWLRALEQNGMVRSYGAEYGELAIVGDAVIESAWQRVEQLQTPGNRTELVEYFRLATRSLPGLLAGEVDALALLFPEGRVGIHEVAYRDNLVSAYLNRLAAETVCTIARHHQGRRPLRILEIGAGVGGTSGDLIAALEPLASGVEYHFTDVSRFFLGHARERFGAHPWVQFHVFDFNREFREQGQLPSSVDIIVCANVLHYAHDADRMLARFRELVRPGGWLVAIETTRDNYQIMTSMEFLFDATVTEFTDVRRGRNETFISRSQWLAAFERSHADHVACLSADDPLLEHLGMHVLAARWKSEQAPLDRDQLVADVASKLPDYMIPTSIEVMDELPRTANGKLDRQTLRTMLSSAGVVESIAEPVVWANDLERRLAPIWAKALARESVTRHESFFELGGDSLVAAQLAAKLREQLPEASAYPFQAILRRLLEGASIERLADMLSRAPIAASTAGSNVPLVALGSAGMGTTIFVHDTTGGVDYARDIVEALGRDRAISGIRNTDGRGLLAIQSALVLERLGADYGAAILAAGQTPARLIGYDWGGLLALEIARNLVESGHRVGSLVVIGSVPPPWRIEDDGLMFYLYVRARGVDPTWLGFPPASNVAAAIAAIARNARGRIPREALTAVSGSPELDSTAWCFRRFASRSREDAFSALARAIARDGTITTAAIETEYECFVHLYRGATMQEPVAYVGDVTLVIPRGGDPLWPERNEQMQVYWRERVLGQVQTLVTAGDITSCLRRPHAGPLASLFVSEPAG